MWGHPSPETKVLGQIPSARHATWPKKKADMYPCTRQISPYRGLLSLWPTAVQTSSSRLCFHAVSDFGTTPCSAKSSVPCPTTASWPFGWHRASLATRGGLLSHRASTGRGQLRSFDSRPYMWALKGCLQGLFDLYYRRTLKAFTSILNGHVYLSPPVAHSNRQGIFHQFVEL